MVIYVGFACLFQLLCFGDLDAEEGGVCGDRLRNDKLCSILLYLGQANGYDSHRQQRSGSFGNRLPREWEDGRWGYGAKERERPGFRECGVKCEASYRKEDKQRGCEQGEGELPSRSGCG